ncbi:hypothetical protein HIM_03142 [Hirsutella minnesotensis 3608]|nr:hypothetical protein HIM_03142 [Hirsutella minnesotensis 3608]
MDSLSQIADALTAHQKSQLHEVADLVLEIIRTLIRMRYICTSTVHIREGPHDISNLVPSLVARGLDPAIIYLYSILPYVDANRCGFSTFFQGSLFTDFRHLDIVEHGRNPFCSKCPKDRLHPWMTPLSMPGNSPNFIVYDAQSHRIGIIGQDYCVSKDPSITGWRPAASRGHQDWRIMRCQPECKEKGEWHCDRIKTRPAGAVLRDILRWFHDLSEIPGDEQVTGYDWKQDVTKPLYQRHGWPGSNFNGDAFEADLLRARTLCGIKWSAKGKLEAQEWKLQAVLCEQYGPEQQIRSERLAAASTIEEEWVALWEMWRTEQGMRLVLNDIADTGRKLSQLAYGKDTRPDKVILEELQVLETKLQGGKDHLEFCRRQAEETGIEGGMGWPNDIDRRQHFLRIIPYCEKDVAVYQIAYSACEREVDSRQLRRTCFTAGEERRLKRRKEWTSEVERLRADVQDISDWITQLPGEAKVAKVLAQGLIRNHQEAIQDYRRKLDGRKGR